MRKHSLLFVFLLILVVFPLFSTEYSGVTYSDNLRVRTGAGVGYDTVKVLPTFSKITIYETAGSGLLDNSGVWDYWYKISAEKQEWINAYYIALFPFCIIKNENGKDYNQDRYWIYDVNNEKNRINFHYKRFHAHSSEVIEEGVTSDFYEGIIDEQYIRISNYAQFYIDPSTKKIMKTDVFSGEEDFSLREYDMLGFYGINKNTLWEIKDTTFGTGEDSGHGISGYILFTENGYCSLVFHYNVDSNEIPTDIRKIYFSVEKLQ